MHTHTTQKTNNQTNHTGPAEELIGAFYRAHPERAPPATQACSKICFFDPQEMRNLTGADVKRAVARSNRRMGVQRSDLLQLYFGDYSVKRYVDAALYLADEAAAGRVAHLGATNFDTERLAEILDAGVPLVAHQVCDGVVYIVLCLIWGGFDCGLQCAGQQRPRKLTKTHPPLKKTKN